MRALASKTDALLQLAGKGPVRARDLDDAGIPRAYLRRLCDRGLIEQVDRGLYRLAAAPISEVDALAAVAMRVPHATVCLLSALQLHGMATEVPDAVWLQNTPSCARNVVPRAVDRRPRRRGSQHGPSALRDGACGRR